MEVLGENSGLLNLSYTTLSGCCLVVKDFDLQTEG